MKKLEVEMFQYDTLLFGKVLYADDSLRGQEGEYRDLIKDDDGYTISSDHCPEITDKTLCIWGNYRDEDNSVFYYRYDNKQESNTAVEHFRALIDVLNNEDSHATNGIVKVI